MDYIILAVAIVVFILFAILILVLKIVAGRRTVAKAPGDSEFSYPDVEYQWSARPPVILKLMIFVALLFGFLVYWYIAGDEEELSGVFQIFIPLAGFLFAFLSGFLKSFTFQITSSGLYVLVPGSKGERKMLFSWSDLLWFKPLSDGFRFYLKTEAQGSLTTSGLGILKGSKIPCGKQATLINAIIMARGIPTSPPRK